MFDNLIQAANKYGAADPVNLAETLWLALHMGAPADKPAEAADPVTNKQPKSETVPLPELPDEEAEESDSRWQPSDQGKSPLRAGDPNNHGSDNNNSKWIGALPSLPNKPRFRQALRAFASHSPRHNNIIDETETAETYAQQGGLWLQPVLEKGMRRWLKVCLVVETGGSNALWAQPLAELEQVLRLRGVFREVSRKTLGPEAAHYQWWKDEIVIVASDFTSDGWWNGEYPNLLHTWASTQPLVCMHTLPARLWRRSWTGKPDAMACAQRPAQETRGWQITLDATAFEFEKPPSRFALPLMEMEAGSMAIWANALTQAAAARTPAIVLAARENAPFEQTQTSEGRSAEQIVMAFKGAASPLARKLAQYLAVTAPLNFPVMRWVQQAMLPESDASHLAEFFLGGLLERVDRDGYSPADEVLYDFVDGVRDLLQQGLRISHGLAVLETVGKYLEAHEQTGFKGFMAGKTEISSNAQGAFALVSKEYMRTIGLPATICHTHKTSPIQKRIAQPTIWDITRKQFHLLHALQYKSETKPSIVEAAKNDAVTQLYKAMLNEALGIVIIIHNQQLTIDGIARSPHEMAEEVVHSILETDGFMADVSAISQEKSRSLRTYASQRIRWKLNEILRTEREHQRRTESFLFEGASFEPSMVPEIDAKNNPTEEKAMLVEKILMLHHFWENILTKREQAVLTHAINGDNDTEGAKRLNITTANYKQIKMIAAKKLRTAFAGLEYQERFKPV